MVKLFQINIILLVSVSTSPQTPQFIRHTVYECKPKGNKNKNNKNIQIGL